jgi:glycine cleavage system transcriptional repressor
MDFVGKCQPQPPKGELYMLTAAGPDAPGQVAAIARYFHERDINIVDLATTPNQGEYLMIFLVEIPADTDVSKLKRSLQLDVARLGLKVEIRHHALFRKTNEI